MTSSIASHLYHLRHGKWEFGCGWWPGSAKVFMCDCTYYDGFHYGFRIGPFWASCYF